MALSNTANENNKKKKNKLVEWMNKHRITTVIVLTVASAALCFILFYKPLTLLKKVDENVRAPLFVFSISVLPSLYFWIIRNKDRLDAIEEQRKDNNYTSFSHALTLLTDKDKVQTRALGLQLLIQIKNVRKLFTDEIDMATQVIDLKNADLAGANLAYVNLQGTNLRYADLRDADLAGANLGYADLHGANLGYADLCGAYLICADLQGANLVDANLQKVNSIKADLCGADLHGAKLQGANLAYVKLQKANLIKAGLCGVDLVDADLQGADLAVADLQDANLGYADLRGADLGYADLRSADLQGANLADADLQMANFTDANLQGVNWAYAQNIEQAIFDDEETKQAVLTLKRQQEQEAKFAKSLQLII